jgi:hypothetical protein
MLVVRVLGLFFSLSPPLLSVPIGSLVGFILIVVAASTVALAGAFRGVTRTSAQSALRAP